MGLGMGGEGRMCLKRLRLMGEISGDCNRFPLLADAVNSTAKPSINE